MDDAPPYTIRYDAAARILHMRLAGFWSAATLAGYAARLLYEVTMLQARRLRYDILSDARDFPVQSAIVAAGFDRIARRGAMLHRGLTAVVVARQLNKLQAERALAAASRARVFLDMDEAMRWIMATRTPGEAAA